MIIVVKNSHTRALCFYLQGYFCNIEPNTFTFVDQFLLIF